MTGVVSTAMPIVDALKARAQTLAVAESLTGGLLAAEFVAVPGVSAVFRGGVVAYDPEVKVALVGVPREVIDAQGVVSAETAAALAIGVRDRFGADWGLGTTGVAGPLPHGGRPPGTVWLGLAGPAGVVRTEPHLFTGDRDRVRRHAVAAVLALFSAELDRVGGQGAC